MNARKWARGPAAVGLGIAILASGCAGGPLPSDAPEESIAVDVTAAPSDTPSLIYGAGDPTKRCGSTTLTIEYPEYTTETLAAKGFDFVVADVVSAQPGIYNTPDGERPAIFSGKPTGTPNQSARPAVYTPIDINVVSPVQGSLAKGPTQVLVLGGRVDCFTMWVSPMPAIEKGARYVFVLSEALASDGKQAMASPQVTLAWPVDEKGMVATDDGQMSLDELTAVVAGAAKATLP